MSLQDDLRKLTTGGPGVCHIAAEDLFERSADLLERYENALLEIAAMGWHPVNGHISIATRALDDKV